jgi:hypothetical protein
MLFSEFQLKKGTLAFTQCPPWYPLSLEVQKQLDDFLKEHLYSGRIRQSKSPMASLSRKKDGALRPVQHHDYRKLNCMTIKNR